MKEILKACGAVSLYAFAPVGMAVVIAVAEQFFNAIIS